MGESASPFIDEGDGLISEREGARLLLSLVAHTGGYKMMVGVHNTVGCQMHVGGHVVFVWVWQTSVSAILLMPRGMRGVFTMFTRYGNSGAHNTVDAQGHVGGLTVRESMAPTTL